MAKLTLPCRRVLAAEFAPHGIRVNTISPALVETAATEYPMANIPGFREQVLSKFMVKRTGQPEDIADVIAFLCSDWASYITGEALHVNGGAYMAG